jgi:hypothetical protein
MVVNVEKLEYYFNLYNIAYFDSELPIPKFDVLHSYRTCGYFNCSYNQGWFNRELYDFKISITDYYDFTEKQFTDIMVHEMIHYYLAYFGIDKQGRHGKKFKEMARRLNRTYGLHITPYLDLSKYKRRKGTPRLSYWLVKKIYM